MTQIESLTKQLWFMLRKLKQKRRNFEVTEILKSTTSEQTQNEATQTGV